MNADEILGLTAVFFFFFSVNTVNTRRNSKPKKKNEAIPQYINTPGVYLDNLHTSNLSIETIKYLTAYTVYRMTCRDTTPWGVVVRADFY